MEGSIQDRLGVIWGLWQLFLDPQRTQTVFDTSERLRKLRSPLREKVLDHFSKQTDFMSQWEARYLPRLSLDNLRQSPPGSLGQALLEHFEKNGLDPHFFPVHHCHSFEDYVVLRMRLAHDVWHVLFKFDVSIPGEAGLQALTLMQSRSPFSMILISLSGLHCLLKKPDLFFEWMNEVSRGFEIGRLSQNLLALEFDRLLDASLDSVLLSLRCRCEPFDCDS